MTTHKTAKLITRLTMEAIDAMEATMATNNKMPTHKTARLTTRVTTMEVKAMEAMEAMEVIITERNKLFPVRAAAEN